MLHVILQILSVIGIILLCILGLLVIVIGLVLFVPVRYRVSAVRCGEDTRINAKATYLLHMLTARFSYPEEGSVIVRLFGIKIYDSGRPPKEGGERKKPSGKADKRPSGKADEKPSGKADKRPTGKTDEKTPEKTPGKTDGTQAEKKTGKADEKTAGRETGKPSGETDNMPEKEDTAAQEEKPQKEKALLEKIGYTIRTICDKIKNIMDVLTDESNKAMYARVWDRVLKILKSIRPRVLRANLHIGTGSPDTTGYLCGVYGMLLPALGNNVHMEADFERAVCEGDIYAGGRISLFIILLQAGKIALDKQLRIFIKELKRED